MGGKGRTAFAPRVAFVVEQTLGHVTHYQNLVRAASRRTDLLPVWLPIPYAPGWLAGLPLVGGNWTVRAGLRARSALRRASDDGLDGVLFHTQVTSVFSVGVMRRVPSVICLDATPSNFDAVGAAYGHRPAGRGFVDRRKHELNRRALAAAGTVIAWSPWTRRSLIDDYGVDEGRIHVIAPGAGRAFFDIGARRFARERRPGPVRLLFVGGDFTRKGGPLLLELMRDGLAADCELHLVTGASVPDAPNVFVHRGVAPNSDELLRLFADADIFVLPTLGDCLPLVLMEATAAALPVVATDIGALSTAVRQGESGLLCPPNDTTAVRAALRGLAGDAARRAAFGRAGHRLANRIFDAERNNDALLDLVVATACAREERGAA